MKHKCVILISHMFNNVTGGAGTYANYLYHDFCFHEKEDFDFFILTHDVARRDKGIIKVDIDDEKRGNFYEKMKTYRVHLDEFMANTQYEQYIIHANSALELSNFLDVPAIKIANVNDYEVVFAARLIALNFKVYGFGGFKKIFGKLRARYHERRVLFKADAVVANSCYTAKCIESGYGLANVRTIYKSCNTSIFGRQPQISASENSFLFVANDWKKKGLIPLLSAIAKFQGDESARIKLTVVGIPDRDYNAVVKVVERFKLSEVVTIRGNLPTPLLAQEYCNHRYLVVPAHIEALGIAILEAMSCGLVVAVADRGGMTEIVVDGVNGFVFEHPTPQAICATLKKMLNLSRRERVEIFIESDRTLQFFNSTRMVDEVSALYSELFGT